MQSYRELVNLLQEKTNSILTKVDEDGFTKLVAALDSAAHIFIHGSGRSGLAGRFFGMRLMHTGKSVSIAGDTATPAIGNGDLLLLISGSGRTASVLQAAQKAKAAGARVLAISAQGLPEPLADLTFLLPAEGVCRQDNRVHAFPLGTLFEVSALLLLESVLAALIQKKQITEKELQSRHSNLE